MNIDLETSEVEPDSGVDGGLIEPSMRLRVLRRIVRRPQRWMSSEWDSSRIWKFSFTAFSLAVTTTIMMNVVHLNPLSPEADLIFDNNTPTGGDLAPTCGALRICVIIYFHRSG